MGTLSKSERDGLKDVFLSIQTNNRYQKLKNYSTLLISNDISLSMSKMLRSAKTGLKRDKITHLFEFFIKKKKNLSK